MINDAASLLGSVLSAAQSIKWTKARRAKLAYALAHLHSELSALVKTGLSLVKQMKAHNDGREIDMSKFIEDLDGQRVSVRKINSIFRHHGLRSALSIHAPQLEPLPVLVRDKGFRLEVLMKKVSDEYRNNLRMHPVTEWPSLSRLSFPPNDELALSKKKLKEMQAQLEELRAVIVANFEIDEVM